VQRRTAGSADGAEKCERGRGGLLYSSALRWPTGDSSEHRAPRELQEGELPRTAKTRTAENGLRERAYSRQFDDPCRVGQVSFLELLLASAPARATQEANRRAVPKKTHLASPPPRSPNGARRPDPVRSPSAVLAFAVLGSSPSCSYCGALCRDETPHVHPAPEAWSSSPPSPLFAHETFPAMISSATPDQTAAELPRLARARGALYRLAHYMPSLLILRVYPTRLPIPDPGSARCAG
jgi:hypothetical protein